MTAPRKKGKDLGNTKEAAHPDSRKRGGGLALRAGGLPARHSLNGSLCMCIGDEAERDKREEMNKESQKKKMESGKDANILANMYPFYSDSCSDA